MATRVSPQALSENSLTALMMMGLNLQGFKPIIICIAESTAVSEQFVAYRNFCGALDWFSLSVGGVGVSRGGVEFVPVDAGPVCGRDAVVRFGRRCLFALPQGVGDE